MIKKITLLLWFAIPLFCMAQQQLQVLYEYDNAGNRIVRKTISIPPQAPPVAPDSTLINPLPVEFYVEKMDQVEIKIYPNPTTEKITLEISDWQNLQTGTFKLYALTGQLLQEQLVHSATTTVSLADLPKGTYILKVHINDRSEDWKIIKQ